MKTESLGSNENQNKMAALERLEGLFTSPYTNAIEYDENNLPKFREKVKDMLITLGELNLDLTIPKNGETEALKMLAQVAKKHRDILGI